MKLIRIFCLALFIITCGVVSPVCAKDKTVTEIMEIMDELYDMRQDLTAKMKFTIKRVGEGVKVIESIFYRRDKRYQR